MRQEFGKCQTPAWFWRGMLFCEEIADEGEGGLGLFGNEFVPGVFDDG